MGLLTRFNILHLPAGKQVYYLAFMVKQPQVGQTICDINGGGRIDRVNRNSVFYGEFRTRISNLIPLDMGWHGTTWGVVDPQEISLADNQKEEQKQNDIEKLLILAERRLTKTALGWN